MNELIDTKKCRLAGDMLHIQFTNGMSYVFSLAEIVVECAGGLTPRAADLAYCACQHVYIGEIPKTCPKCNLPVSPNR